MCPYILLTTGLIRRKKEREIPTSGRHRKRRVARVINAARGKHLGRIDNRIVRRLSV
jgi:hypothetical protein